MSAGPCGTRRSSARESIQARRVAGYPERRSQSARPGFIWISPFRWIGHNHRRAPHPAHAHIIWKLGLPSRSLRNLNLLERVEEKNARFRSLTEAIDTTTPTGRMMMQMVRAFAEFERAMIRERTRAGLKSTRAEGSVGDQPRKLFRAQRI